jgi:hypothetical protein
MVRARDIHTPPPNIILPAGKKLPQEDLLLLWAKYEMNQEISNILAQTDRKRRHGLRKELNKMMLQSLSGISATLRHDPDADVCWRQNYTIRNRTTI